MAKKLYPMPVEPIIRDPLAMALPGAAIGALIRLCFHFWETECRPLPRDDYSLRQLARAHGPTWRHHRDDVLKVFEAVQPALASYHDFRVNQRGQLRIAAHNGVSSRIANAAAKRIQQSAPPPATSHHQLGITPQREPAPQRPLPPDKRPKRPVRSDTI